MTKLIDGERLFMIYFWIVVGVLSIYFSAAVLGFMCTKKWQKILIRNVSGIPIWIFFLYFVDTAFRPHADRTWLMIVLGCAAVVILIAQLIIAIVIHYHKH